MTKTFALSRFAVAAAAVALVVGCGVPPSDSDTAIPGDTGAAEPDDNGSVAPDDDSSSLAEQLMDRSFETTSPDDVVGYDLVADSALTLSFYRDHEGASAVGGDAGCNAMGGAATWEDNTVRATELIQTEMACEGLMEQEAWWAGLLTDGVALELDGDILTVTAGSAGEKVTITMTDAAVLHPDQPLVGTNWQLDGIIDGIGDSGAVSSVPDGRTGSMSISRESDGHLQLDIFDGLTTMSVPAGYDATAAEYDGSVTIEPADADDDPENATSGIVRITGGLGGNAPGCPEENPDCFIAELYLVGSDFAFETHRDRLTITGTGDNANKGLMFVAE